MTDRDGRRGPDADDQRSCCELGLHLTGTPPLRCAEAASHATQRNGIEKQKKNDAADNQNDEP